MKKLLQLTLLLVAILVPATSGAYNFKVDNIYYRITSENEVAVTYKSFYNGGDDYFDEWYSDYTGDIVIPPYVTYNGNTYSVTSIEYHAFEDCSGVTSLTIPITMKSIDNLSDCTGIKELTWNARYCSLWGLNASNIEKVTIGNEVELLPSGFVQDSKITSIVIPNSVTFIGDNAFNDCTNLTSITFSNSLTHIGSNAFTGTAWYNNKPNGMVYAGWVALGYKGTMPSGTSITIANGTQAIADCAFSGCSNLSSITIPNSVTTIGYSTFNNCTGLTEITIPNSVTVIADYLFSGCTGLTSINMPNSITNIGKYAFSECTGLTGINIPNSVISIGNYAFNRCNGLTSLYIPNSVTSIGQYAFYMCLKIENISFGNSVTEIGEHAFEWCIKITNINLPNSVKTIGNWAFMNCTKLANINIATSTVEIGYEAFKSTAWLNAQPSYGLIYLGSIAYLFNGTMSNNTVITIREGTQSIGSYAFYHCTGLKSITIPNSVTFIGRYAFCGCSGLTGTLTIPDSVTYIGDDAFYGCRGLTGTLTIPDRVTYIGGYAFCECSGFTSAHIGHSVSIIGDDAFFMCSAMKHVYSYIPDPSIVNTGNCFYLDEDRDYYSSDYTDRTLHVPFGSQTAYLADKAWYRFFGSIVEMEPNPVLATLIELDETDIVIIEGETLQLTATVMPEDATNKSVTWETSDEAVATVDQNGLVTAVGAGVATITASTMDGSNLTASCTVSVEPNVVLASSIELNQTSANVTEGETLQLTATVLPEDATDKTVTWASSDETVATVNQNGLVTAVATGTATITATTIDGSNLSATCVVTVSVPASANNTLDADALNARCGEEKQLAVRMDNESLITALQCDIYLPAGVSIATEDGDYLIDLVPARKATNHTVSTNDLPNGAIRLFITSATSKPFKGNSGDLFILNLVVDGDAESGEYSLDLRNIILSDTEAHPYYVPDLNVPVTIMDYIKGDVNIDGTVNVSDYVATANYILELDPHPFLFVAADIDENLAINVSDLVGVANIALNFMGAPAVNHAPAMGYDGDGLMSFTADCSTISSNKHIVTLDLSNSSAVTAFQMDINLQEGLKLVNASLSGRGTASHSLEMTTLASGAYRLLGASMMSKAFVGSEGTLLTLEIEGATSGMAVIDGIMLAEPDATLHNHDAMTLAFDNTGVQEMMSDVSIYLQNGMVVVESPVASKVQFILPNGMSVVHEVKPGRNIYNTGLEGVVIVKVGSQVKKFKL